MIGGTNRAGARTQMDRLSIVTWNPVWNILQPLTYSNHGEDQYKLIIFCKALTITKLRESKWDLLTNHWSVSVIDLLKHWARYSVIKFTADQLTKSPTGWLSNLHFYWWCGWLTNPLIVQLVDWWTGILTDCLIDWLTIYSIYLTMSWAIFAQIQGRVRKIWA